MVVRLGRGESLRRVASLLRVSLGTAFRWRHRLLSALDRHPQPILHGRVCAAEVLIRYSQKGCRQTHGPGSWGFRAGLPGPRRFRRFADGKPVGVLILHAPERCVTLRISRGRPRVSDLVAGLPPALGMVEEFRPPLFFPYHMACEQLGIKLSGMPDTDPLFRSAVRLQGTMYFWFKRFHGVATRYLDHYLTWYRRVVATGGRRPWHLTVHDFYRGSDRPSQCAG